MEVAARAGHPHGEQVVVAAHLGGVAVEPVHHPAAPAQRLAVADRPRRGPWRAGRAHGDGELHAGPRLQQELVLGAARLDVLGRRREGDGRRARHVVEAAVGEPDGGALGRGRQHLAAALARMAADLEDVDEIGGHAERQRQLVRLAREGLDQQELVQHAGVDGHPPRDAQRAARQHHLRGQRHVGVGEIDGGLHGVLGHAGVEDDRAMAVQPQLELAQEAGAVDVEAELAVGHVGQVAAAAGHQERFVVLEDELRQVGGQLGGEDVVLLADDHIPRRGARVAHAAWRRAASRPYTAS